MTPRGRRLARVLRLEIERLCRDLPERRDFLVATWSRLRSREAFDHTLFSRWRTVTAGDLAELPEPALDLLHVFYDRLADLTIYVRLTDDMPQTLGDQLDAAVADLVVIGEAALEALP
jgi:hypothetical protein